MGLCAGRLLRSHAIEPIRDIEHYERTRRCHALSCGDEKQPNLHVLRPHPQRVPWLLLEHADVTAHTNALSLASADQTWWPQPRRSSPRTRSSLPQPRRSFRSGVHKRPSQSHRLADHQYRKRQRGSGSKLRRAVWNRFCSTRIRPGHRTGVKG